MSTKVSDLDTTIARLVRMSPEQDAADVRRAIEDGMAVVLAERFNIPHDRAWKIVYPQTLARRLTKLNRYLDEVGA